MKIILTNKLIKKNLYSKKLSKYVAAFDYTDKVSIVLSATSGGVCIISSVSIVEAPIGIAGTSFPFIFSPTTVFLIITRSKNKKHDEINMFAKSKLNSIETLVSQTLIDMCHEISHKEFITILKEKHRYDMIKGNMRNVNEKQQNMRLNSASSKT